MQTRKNFALLLVACGILRGTTVHAQQKAGQYELSGTGTISRLKPTANSTDSVYDAGAFQLTRPPLAAGEGRREVAVYCNRCHSPMYVTMQPPLPADAWVAEVSKMQKTFGADIPDEVAKQIVRYLQSNYTPDTRKH